MSNQSAIEGQAHAGRNRAIKQGLRPRAKLAGVVDRNDLLCDMVACKISEVRATGISEPERSRKCCGPDGPAVRPPDPGVLS